MGTQNAEADEVIDENEVDFTDDGETGESSSEGSSGLGAGAIAGIVIGCVAGVLVAAIVVVLIVQRGGSKAETF